MLKGYKNFTISVRDALDFSVTTPEGEELEERFDSASQAREFIDGLSRARSVAAKSTIDLPVLDENGVPRKIAGIHLSRGDLLVHPGGKTGDNARFSDRELYPDTAWLRLGLAKKVRLEAQLMEVEGRLKSFIIERPWDYDFDKDDYEASAKRLIRDYNHRKNAALKAERDSKPW